MTSLLELAIDKLAMEFSSLDLTFHKMDGGREGDITSYWPGREDEDILVCVFKGTSIEEPFHRQDFFFFNYAYENSYQALSSRYDNLITIHEDECYISQPYGGYALRCHETVPSIIFGVLVRKDAFFRDYLSLLKEDMELFRFFVEPHTNRFSEEFLLLSLTKDHAVRKLLEMMVVEYADRKEDTQAVLKTLLSTLLLQIARRYRVTKPKIPERSVTQEMVQYIRDHSASVTLSDLAREFSYHPNYISSMLSRKTGKAFSRIVLEERMSRALLLIRNTTLPLEHISTMLGYSDQSNFYKAFREYYGASPRDYLHQMDESCEKAHKR